MFASTETLFQPFTFQKLVTIIILVNWFANFVSANESIPPVSPNNTIANTVPRLGNGPHRIPSLPSLSCYVCRSDYSIDCVRNVEKANYEKCTAEVVKQFADFIEREPLRKPVPEYGRTGESPEDFACYSVLSSDKTSAVRTCMFAPATKGDECNPCKLFNQPATCCVCQKSFCNDVPNHAHFVINAGLSQIMIFFAGLFQYVSN